MGMVERNARSKVIEHVVRVRMCDEYVEILKVWSAWEAVISAWTERPPLLLRQIHYA